MGLGFIALGFLFSGTTQLLRPSYFIRSCYLAVLLSGLGDNASVRFVYPWFIVFSANPVWRSKSYLRTFALIVSGHPYCASNSLQDVMPPHALSAHAVEEMWRYIALVGTLKSMNGFNSHKCSVTPYFLLIDHFLCRLSTFCEN